MVNATGRPGSRVEYDGRALVTVPVSEDANNYGLAAGAYDALAGVLPLERQFRVSYAETFSAARQALCDYGGTHLLRFFSQ